MNIMINTRRFKPDTAEGEKFQIIYTYTSFNKQEIDDIEERVKEITNGAYATIIRSGEQE